MNREQIAEEIKKSFRIGYDIEKYEYIATVGIRFSLTKHVSDNCNHKQLKDAMTLGLLNTVQQAFVRLLKYEDLVKDDIVCVKGK